MNDSPFDHPEIEDEETSTLPSRRGSDKTNISRASTSSGFSKIFRNPWGR